MKIFLLFFILSLTALLYSFQNSPTIKFRKQMIAYESAESVGVFDVNGDKVLDIMSGSYWYEGPGFLKRHFIGNVKRVSEYYDDFSTIPMDVNGDGRMDFVTGGWFGKTLVWKENPGNEQEWPVHTIMEIGNIETTRAWDIDGDGVDEIVPNTPGLPLSYFTLMRDKNGKATGQFSKTQVMEKHGHGLGFGDLNGDGRGDFIVSEGWAEAPASSPPSGAGGSGALWKFHPDFNLGSASIPIIVTDVNQDGANDFIVGQGHGFGLDWYEQKKEGVNSKFIKHSIDPYHAQYHTMALVDIDSDGKQELITGKRYRAHNGNDPGDNENPGLYYFKWNGESFTKGIISYGPFGEGKGTGLFFSVADLNNSGKMDIIVAGKDGLCVFFNESK
jgi:FG-GAP-like repeat